MNTPLKALVYKRTHRGDPDDSGIFGVNDCMGQVRGWDFNAVVGVGGKCPDRDHEDIAGKVNWIGTGPFRVGSTTRGPLLKFKWFRRYDETGPDFKSHAPHLFQHMFIDKPGRALLSQRLLSEEMRNEVQSLITWAKNNRQFQNVVALPKSAAHTSCSKKCRCC